jgi:tRNA threonylcarbamoyladenosine biosynthesis protein TsaB
MTGPWLAIDTATDIASVAVGGGNETVARAIRGARQHAAQIIPLVDEVLAAATVSLDQIAGIIVGDGPGSFTGLRIGWAAAKGLTHGRQRPLIAIPSLLAAAHASGVETVAACYDALRGQVFGAIYAFVGDQVRPVVGPDVFTMAELMAANPRRPPVLAVGDGAVRYADDVKRWTGRAPVALDALPPLAASLLDLFDYDGARSPIGDASVAEPAYGRPAEAQVKWESRHGRPLPHSSR